MENITLSEFVVMLITLFLVPSIAQGIKLFNAKTGKELSREQITAIVFVISLLFGALLVIPALDTVSSFLNFLEQLAARSGIVFGYATLIYNLILGKLFEATNLTTDRFR